jgi:hypothetical protein
MTGCNSHTRQITQRNPNLSDSPSTVEWFSSRGGAHADLRAWTAHKATIAGRHVGDSDERRGNGLGRALPRANLSEPTAWLGDRNGMICRAHGVPRPKASLPFWRAPRDGTLHHPMPLCAAPCLDRLLKYCRHSGGGAETLFTCCCATDAAVARKSESKTRQESS